MTIKVLICDDAAELRLLYEVTLRAEPDIEVIGEAADGNEAVSKTNALHPDLVLMDINMPDRTGLEALLHIRAQHPQTKVIMLTALSQPAMVECAMDLGAADYIVKGEDINQIAERIRRACSSS